MRLFGRGNAGAPQRAAGPATLQERLEDAGGAVTATADSELPPLRDPVALLAHLDASGHFHRDGPAGRLYHRGMVSLRENQPNDSLHVVVDDNRLAAHVDAVSPLTGPARGTAGYSLRRAILHNVVGIYEDALWLLRGRQGDHDCVLECEWAPGEASPSREAAGLLDPAESAWSVQLEASVGGRLDEVRLRSALDAVLGPRSATRDVLELVACRDEDELDAARSRLYAMQVATGDRPPLHVLLARHPDGDVLMLNLNHAACDGFGALRVLRSIARAYAGDHDDRPLDFLAAEDLPVRPAAGHAPLHRRLRKRAVERLRDVLSQPAELAADDPGEDPGVGFQTFVLAAAETRRLHAVDPSRAGTSALVAALHLTIARWNRDHDASGRRIGVLIAANLRPQRWQQQTIGNFSLNTRVSTTGRERSGARAALKAVGAQVERYDRARTGIALIEALRRNGMLGLWAKQSIVVLRPLTTNHSVDAAMLCDLGAVDGAAWFGEDAGEVCELWFSTPSRSPLSISVGAVTVAGRLNVTLRYPRCLFSADAAERFAKSYARQLRVVGTG
ncbi:MAG: hypothetical protein QOG94_2186 [Solirubrobacteraceae bacterium]|nr:hypothetical protein [Solirubrobacteraceae bacterium]